MKCTTVKAFVGIDVSKDKINVGMKDDQGQLLMNGNEYAPNQEDLERFWKEVMQICFTLDATPIFGLEATGIYHLPVYEFLKRQKANVHLLNPLEIKKSDQRRVRKTKTDKFDSIFIAEALMLKYLVHHEYRPSGDIAQLRELCRIRFRLIRKRASCKKMVIRNMDILCRGYDKIFQDILGPASIAVIKASIRKTRYFQITKEELLSCFSRDYRPGWKEKQADAILKVFEGAISSEDDRDAHITEIHMNIQQFELINDQIERIDRAIEKTMDSLNLTVKTIPGIGTTTMATLIGEIGDINRFSNPQQLVAFIGIDPAVYASGRSCHIGHISKRGSTVLREIFYQAAFASLKSNPVVREYYNRLKNRGKHHKICMIAASRKLALIVYSVWKNNKEFTVPDHLKTEASTS